MRKNYYFVSDLHFGLLSDEDERTRELSFVKFLNSIKEEAVELYILGDLFDFWFEYKRVIQKGYHRTFTALEDLTLAGVKVHYIIGNHDFMHRDFFEKFLGVRLYQSDIETEIKGKKFYLSHGDGLVKNDYGYLILKKIFRNKLLQKLYSLIHPNFGIKIARGTSKTSRDYTGKKNYGEVDGMFEFAKSKIEQGNDYVILGHSHDKEFKSYKNGNYINLGTWLDEPSFGLFCDGEFKVIDWK